MAAIAVLVLMQAVLIWCLRRWQDAHYSPMPLPQLTEATVDAPKSMEWSALTEDDVILFGLALEASDDVISDLSADSR